MIDFNLPELLVLLVTMAFWIYLGVAVARFVKRKRA